MVRDWHKKSSHFGSFRCFSESKRSTARTSCTATLNPETSFSLKITPSKLVTSAYPKFLSDHLQLPASEHHFTSRQKSATISHMGLAQTCGLSDASFMRCAHWEYYFLHVVSLRGIEYDCFGQEDRDGWSSSFTFLLFQGTEWHRHVCLSLCRKMFVKDNKKRITAEQIIKTPYIMNAISDFVKNQGRL